MAVVNARSRMFLVAAHCDAPWCLAKHCVRLAGLDSDEVCRSASNHDRTVVNLREFCVTRSLPE